MSGGIYDQITHQWLKDTFLLGIDLTLDDGTAYPDTIFEQSIQAAIRHVESDLGVCVEPFTVTKEAHDAERQNRFSYWPFRLDHRPVQRIDAMRIKFGSFEGVDIPTSWARFTSNTHGQINLIPSQESLGSYFFTAGVPLMGGYGIYEDREYIPSYFEIDYTAGFETREGTVTLPAGETSVTVELNPRILLKYLVSTDLASARTTAKGQESFTITVPTAFAQDTVITWTADTLPADLKHAIGIKGATLLLLHVAGDLILGAGIASQSLSVDGLSQNIDTTSSAMYNGYSARAHDLGKQYDKVIKALKSQYTMTHFGVV